MRILKKPIAILYLLFSIVLVSIAFQNCSSPFEANTPNSSISGFNVTPGDEATVNEIKSLAIFEKTLYNDIQQNCASCHGTIQKPLFAISNSLDSHRVLFNKDYVNLEAPENSYLAIKIRAGHNNFPVTMAEQFTDSIRSWSTQLQEALEEPPVVEPPIGEPPVEEPPVEEPPVEDPPAEEPPSQVNENETFAFIFKNTLQPKCATCHRPRAEGGLGLKDNYLNYSTTMAGSSVVPGNSEASSLYQEIVSGNMPPGGGLSDDEVNGIKAWIDQGAKDN